jgi:hypothetical protein
MDARCVRLLGENLCQTVLATLFWDMGAWRDRHLRACVSLRTWVIWQQVGFSYEASRPLLSQRQYNRSNL